jgi:acetylornithine deacetylase/succinyl-diaminopimelate desuccinylase-like protein
MIPDRCTIRVDTRPQPGIALDEVRRVLQEALDRAAAPGRAAAVSLEQMKRDPNGDAGQADAADTPRCQEHTTLQFQCHKCYAWQVNEWRKDPIT